jgi:hypothetical protein
MDSTASTRMRVDFESMRRIHEPPEQNRAVNAPDVNLLVRMPAWIPGHAALHRLLMQAAVFMICRRMPES